MILAGCRLRGRSPGGITEAVRNWSQEQTACAFLATADTIRLVQLAEPGNKFPQFVRYIVQQPQTPLPMLGKVKIAQILAWAGLHLGAQPLRIFDLTGYDCVVQTSSISLWIFLWRECRKAGHRWPGATPAVIGEYQTAP